MLFVDSFMVRTSPPSPLPPWCLGNSLVASELRYKVLA
jgi:hypothetical protein